MTDALRRMTTEDLRPLAAALQAGRLQPPWTAIALERFVPRPLVYEVAVELQQLDHAGWSTNQLVSLLEMLIRDRSARPAATPTIELVSTGPTTDSTPTRQTAVAVRELFASAHESVLVVGFAVNQGRQVFQTLAHRMEQIPDLKVRLCLNVPRGWNDTSRDSELVLRFAHDFQQHEWPGQKLPDVFYDPRSLDTSSNKRTSLHAKCIVIDDQMAFISSANFTEAAQSRNIEVGVLLRSSPSAIQLVAHIDELIATGVLLPLPWPSQIHPTGSPHESH